jgi:hypothetical protein
MSRRIQFLGATALIAAILLGLLLLIGSNTRTLPHGSPGNLFVLGLRADSWAWFFDRSDVLNGASPFMLALGILAVVFATSGPAYVRRRLQWQKRLRGGCCVWCGYDLRASAGICPECGNPVIRAATTNSAGLPTEGH